VIIGPTPGVNTAGVRVGYADVAAIGFTVLNEPVGLRPTAQYSVTGWCRCRPAPSATTSQCSVRGSAGPRRTWRVARGCAGIRLLSRLREILRGARLLFEVVGTEAQDLVNLVASTRGSAPRSIHGGSRTSSERPDPYGASHRGTHPRGTRGSHRQADDAPHSGCAGRPGAGSSLRASGRGGRGTVSTERVLALRWAECGEGHPLGKGSAACEASRPGVVRCSEWQRRSSGSPRRPAIRITEASGDGDENRHGTCDAPQLRYSDRVARDPGGAIA
jgi:hypothetical protein